MFSRPRLVFGGHPPTKEAQNMQFHFARYWRADLLVVLQCLGDSLKAARRLDISSSVLPAFQPPSNPTLTFGVDSSPPSSALSPSNG